MVTFAASFKNPVNFSGFFFCLSQRANCCLGITSQMNATFLETSCAVMGAVSRGPGSVMGCQTALMTVMSENAVSDIAITLMCLILQGLAV